MRETHHDIMGTHTYGTTVVAPEATSMHDITGSTKAISDADLVVLKDGLVVKDRYRATPYYLGRAPEPPLPPSWHLVALGALFGAAIIAAAFLLIGL